MTDRKIKCQCPETANVSPDMEHMFQEEEKAGMKHQPNKCLGSYQIGKFKRGEKELWLCSCCSLTGDIRIS